MAIDKKKSQAIVTKKTNQEAALSGDINDIPRAKAVSVEALAGYTLKHRVKLEAGEMIEGLLLGEGAPIEITDKDTGEVSEIRSWELQVGRGKVAILPGCFQLDRELPQYKGQEIAVVRGPQVDTRAGKRVNTFLVGPKM